MKTTTKNPAAVALGRLGGAVKSAAKTETCRANARRPRPRWILTFQGEPVTGMVWNRSVKPNIMIGSIDRAMTFTKAEACKFVRHAKDPAFLATTINDYCESLDLD
jgi:hypothetical protein